MPLQANPWLAQLDDSPVVIHLVRHGEVENPESIVYGRLPGYGLSARGLTSAATTARYLASAPLAACLSSPLQRTRQTAEAIAAEHAVAVRTDDRLVEAWNRFEGTRFSLGRLVTRQPWALRHLVNPLRPSWGEPYSDLARRMCDAIASAQRRFTGQHVALVSHQAPIWSTRRALSGQRFLHDPRRRQCAPASVTTLTVERGAVRVSYWEPAYAESEIHASYMSVLPR